MKRSLILCALIATTLAACDRHEPMLTAPDPQQAVASSQNSTSDDPALIAMLNEVNRQLAARRLPIAAESIEFFTIGAGRPGARLHQLPFRWVAGDARRAADGSNITYLVDMSEGGTSSGLKAVQTETAIDRAMDTWRATAALAQAGLVKRPDPRSDVTIYDSFFGYGKYGNPFAADIVNAGWFPEAFFETVGGPGGGTSILAFSVSFVFTDDAGNPTDINGDNYLDTALNEVYYNDAWGNRRSAARNFPWGIDVALPGIDVETVALHENGHSLALGHFGAPPVAVMNPFYAGLLHAPLSVDEAGLSTLWQSWPR